MNDSFSRRQFLDASGRLLAGLGTASLLSSRAAAAPASKRLTLATREVLLPRTPGADCWTVLKSIGAEGVEATIQEDLSLPALFHPRRKYTAATPSGIEQLVDDMKAAGCRITALCTYNRFDDRPDFEIQWGTKVARAAQALGAKAVRIDVVPHKMAAESFLGLCAQTLKRLLQATESTGVAFGIENHGATTNDPEFLRPLFERVGSKRLGLTLDTGNFYWYGHPLSKLYELYEEFATRVFHTHCKSIHYPAQDRQRRRPIGWEYAKYHCPLDQGDIDFRRVIGILVKAGYQNDLCIEDESLGKCSPAERIAVLAREVRYLKDLL